MSLDILVLEIRQLPILTRLALIQIITESVRQELAEESKPHSESLLTRGMLQPKGTTPTEQELKDDYINYLIDKYR